MSGSVCSTALLTQPSTNRESDWECACMQNSRWTFWTLAVSMLRDWKSYGHTNGNQLCLFSKTCSFIANFAIFTVLKFSKVRHLLSNNYTKYYWNRQLLFEIIIAGWYEWYIFLQHSVGHAISTLPVMTAAQQGCIRLATYGFLSVLIWGLVKLQLLLRRIMSPNYLHDGLQTWTTMSDCSHL